jgi:aryl-alcohol dehydrogenase-like predicted oxidoreductase
MSNRLALGTAQFGLAYGISNKIGQVAKDSAAGILDAAWCAGVRTLDTAIAYGESEQRLGDVGVEQWRVVTKLPGMPSGTIPSDWVFNSVEASLRRLRVPRLRGLLLHQPDLLLQVFGGEIYRALQYLKDAGKVEKIGISIYSPEDLDAILPHYPMDIVQGPFNVLDRRLRETGWLEKLQKAGVEVHVRSAFLQGLLLMSDEERPKKFRRWEPLFGQWRSWLNDAGVSPLRACLGYALAQPEVDCVVVGVESQAQMNEILSVASEPTIMPPEKFQCNDTDLINPSRWNDL